jgi:tudor domain-containing protein 2
MLRAPETPTLKLILGLELCSLGGAMLYAYLKNKEDEDDLEEDASDGQKTQKEITFRMTGVKDARSMLMKDIQRSPIVKEEMYVPHSVYTKIIGRCGECLRDICRSSMAKVSVESADRIDSKHPRRTDISGTKAQVNLAKKLIDEKMKEDQELQRECNEVESKREPRRSPTNSTTSLSSSQTSLASVYPQKEKLPFGDISERPMEVYVSAIGSPAKFWLQLIGPQTKKLDEFVNEMTTYYNEKDYHKIDDPYLGQIVAALFKYDGKWYRA